MNRPLLIIGIALVSLGLVAGVIGFAFRDEWRDEHDPVEYRVLDGDGQATGSVVVIDDGREWRGAPGFFPFFPLVVVGGVLIAIAVFTRGRRHWHGGGPGDFESWHREVHWNWGSAAPREAPPSNPESGS